MERWLRDVWDGRRPIASIFLLPLSLLWWVGSVVHRGIYALGIRRAARVGAPVVAIGNLTIGGAGKTPVTRELASRLLSRGRRAAVVSRGYGRRTHGVVIVSDGETIRANAQDGGDEPVWLARRERGLIVVVGEKRAAAAATAVDLGADIVLLDDGLSHYGLEQDVKVIVIDGQRSLGNGRLLPAGPLRLFAGTVRNADLLWWTRVSPNHPLAAPKPLHSCPSVQSTYAPAGLLDLDLAPREPVSALAGKRVLAVCGIARPDGFESTLLMAGANVRALSEFPDHHIYSAADVAHIESTARAERCDWIVTTEKDAVRLSSIASGDLYRALAMEVHIQDTTAIDALVRRFVPDRPLEAA
jgi:tetraacyldisaccharide 4'-kinase